MAEADALGRLSGDRRDLTIDGRLDRTLMDLTVDPPGASRGGLPAECPDVARGERAARHRCRRATPREGFARHLEWERTLFDARWAVVSWPEEYGGRDASLWEWLIFEEEYYRAGAPQRVTQNGIFLLAPTIFEFGTPEQQDGILPRMAAAEDLWCQGWSRAQRRAATWPASPAEAVRDDAAGGWRLTGQKTWTTRGAFCTHLFGLFRTDPARPSATGASPTSWSRSTPRA